MVWWSTESWGAAAKPGQQQVPCVSSSALLWGSFPLALLSLPIAPALAGPCGVPWGQGQDELWLCWAGMSKGP